MAIKRIFLGWNRPGLSVAADYLVERFGQPGAIGLAGVIAVVPGARAGRRLLEILIEAAEGRQAILDPPRVETIGRLPELLYQPKRPFAGTLTQQLAWVKAVRDTDPNQLSHVFAVLPPEGDMPAWLTLGEMLARLHRELAAEGLQFADVAKAGTRVAEFAESPRWQALAEIQRQYLRTLDSLELWDVQTARLVAVKEKECRIEAEVVLIGMADMNRAMRQMLDQVESKVTSLVLAPSELADRFDSHGCLAPERWQEAIIDLADDQIALVDDPADQAAAAVRWIASLDGRYRGEDITLGVPDAQVLPHLEQYLAQAGVSARYGVGKPVAQSGPYRLLAGAADFLEDGRFSSLAAMLRNPAVQKWLEKKVPGEGWLTRLDEYYSSHLPYGLEDFWLDSGGDCGKHETAPEQPVRGRLKPGLQRGEDWRVLQRAREQIEALLEGFRGEQRPLGQWGQTVLDLLAAVFGTRSSIPRPRPIVRYWKPAQRSGRRSKVTERSQGNSHRGSAGRSRYA